MMNPQRLRALFEAYYQNDAARFRTAAMQAACDVRSEKDRLLLIRMVEQARAQPLELFGKEAASMVVALPQRGIETLVLTAAARAEFVAFVEERKYELALREHRLCPRSRVLLHGPPGCGKTSLAAALATELRLNGFVLMLSAVRYRFLGETAQRLTKAFDVARHAGCLLLIDEVDALGETRGGGDGSLADREGSAIVATLLQLLDQPTEGVLVAATNRLDMVDPAIRRRFDAELELPFPAESQAEAFAEELFRRHEWPRPKEWVVPCASFDAIEKKVMAAVRNAIIESEKRKATE